ncbi:MAG: hypothetical protein K6T68_11025, partial [Alicyclobacillus shizuokensis]|nr:hypothetical protein [Alicyclobacillus shizuokensis]
ELEGILEVTDVLDVIEYCQAAPRTKEQIYSYFGNAGKENVDELLRMLTSMNLLTVDWQDSKVFRAAPSYHLSQDLLKSHPDVVDH